MCRAQSPFSLVIPAHNEAVVLPRLLVPLHREAVQRGVHIDVIVVANACTDDTASAARRAWPGAVVVETREPGKANALNLADAELDRLGKTGHRIYVDADVELSLDSLFATAEALDEPGTFAAAPRMHVDLTYRTWLVRAYYNVWTRLPYATRGMIGSGIYALSPRGRARFASFPLLTADDGFVRRHFNANERKTVTSHTFTITPPRTLERIIAIKTRSVFGNLELDRRCPSLRPAAREGHAPALLKRALNPTAWPAIAVYLYVKVATRWQARQSLSQGINDHWDRDDTSRQPMAVA